MIMKKLVLVAALFMFVCGGSFVANAQDPVKTQQQQPATGNTEEPKTAEPAKEEPKTEEPKAEEPKAEQPAANAPTKAVPSLSILGNGFCRFSPNPIIYLLAET